MMELDNALVQELRLLAVDGQSPMRMYSFVESRLGKSVSVIIITFYFRKAFCLNLLEAKPIVTYILANHILSDIEIESLINEAMTPIIEQHRQEWTQPILNA